MSNPNRRRRPVWCGDVDTTRPGATWDVQDDGCCGPCKPPVPGCGPVRPPMPQFPDCGYHIPPVQYVPGMNEQEQLANLNCKMNELIELFNCNTDKVFGAYEEVVRSAVCNDAFYKEITVESGYLADASTSYELVHIPFVDCACQPIYMEMGLAYNNTTNSGVTESVFDKALEVYADKILPAAERSFQGVAIWKGAPIYSGADGARALVPGQCDYTLGVTENGFFKIYDTPNDKDNSGMLKSMRQDKVRNSMGCAVIIRGGEYVEDENLADMELPCTVLAMNYKTKERFILAIGKDNVASAITPEMIANLLKKYDVDVAALTSWGQQSYLLDKGQFSFMPTSTDSDGIPTVPQSAAFWYITKRRHFHNDYVKEVAALTIQMGENLWYDELTSEAVDNLKLDFVDLRNDLEQEIQDRKDADEALSERIDKEIAEREAADTALDEKYAAEVTRIDAAIDALSQRVTDEVTRLDALIQSTKEALTAKDVKEVKVTHDGTRDTYQVVLNDGTALGADVIVYNYDQLVQKLDSYATVEQRLDAEIQARKDADDALNALITAEQQARANGDTALAQQIESVRTELTELIQGNTTSITGLQTALDTLTQTVQSNYTSLNERVTSNAENIANLQGTYGALQATVSALNETVTGLQQSFASTEESFENVKQTVANIQTELNEFEARIEGELGNYLPLSGGTMKGPIHVKGNDLTRVNQITFGTSGTYYGKVFMEPDTLHVNGTSGKYGDINVGEVNIHSADNAHLSFSYDESKNFLTIVRSNGGLPVRFDSLDPTEDSNVANKKYVDTVGENLASEIAQVGGQFENYLPLSGGTVTGPTVFQQEVTADTIDMSGGPNGNILNAMTVEFKATQQNPSGYAIMRNATLQGFGAYNDSAPTPFAVGTPTQDYHAATKSYVDSAVAGYLPLSGGQMRGALDMNFKNVENIRRVSFGEVGNSRYYALFEDETLKLIEQNIHSESIGHFNLHCEAITSWRGFMNIGVKMQTSANSTPEKPILDISGTYQSAKVRVRGIATPTHDDDAATKGYVDTADEGFLYVDGGRLYGHGETPQGVLLDKIDFASQGVEAAGVATLSISGTTGNLVMSILDESLTHIPLRFGAGELTDSSAGVNMAVLGNYMRGGVNESVTSANVKATDLLTGLYIIRYVSEVYMINVTGSTLNDIVITSSKIMGIEGGITFNTEVVDINTMKLTFSSVLETGFRVTKLIGSSAYIEVSILS